MALITLLDAQLAFGHVPLLDHADFSLETQERVGLIGRNGAGKSSMLKILGGLDKPDDGLLQVQGGLRIAYVAQEPQLAADASVFEAVSAGMARARALIDEYSQGHGDLDAMQSEIESLDGWNWEQRVGETLQRLHLDAHALIGTLSGGNKKRVALAQALVAAPDVLLLDEPTNHLDLDSIEWLEGLLCEFKGSMICVTHDRSFLDNVATRIVELDRGQLLSYPGNFAAYLRQKAEQLAQEAVINARADKLLAQEEIWIRKGVEARRTRAQARIERLQALRAEHATRRNTQGSVKMDVASGAASGKLVSELTHVSKSFGDNCIVRDFSATILRGDKIGLLGPNGAGKSTLLKMILGELQPDSGTVKLGTKIAVAYFDQLRQQLDDNATLADTISQGADFVEIGGQRKHIISYLGDFLFSPERARSPVKSCSGGERNRLLLARLFTQPANVLVLDEPTNDLDIETLELLEELLANYNGTLFLVSHDRAFLDNVVTQVIAFEGDGKLQEYVGGFEDWERVQKYQATLAKPAPAPARATAPPAAAQPKTASKLSYKESRELAELPLRIEALEKEQIDIAAHLADGTIFRTDAKRAKQLQTRSEAIDAEVLTAMTRWEELDKRNK